MFETQNAFSVIKFEFHGTDLNILRVHHRIVSIVAFKEKTEHLEFFFQLYLPPRLPSPPDKNTGGEHSSSWLRRFQSSVATFRLQPDQVHISFSVISHACQQTHVRLLRVDRPSVASSPKSEYCVSKNADSRTPARASFPLGRQYSAQLMNTWRTSAAKSSTASYALSDRFFLMVPKSTGLCTKLR